MQTYPVVPAYACLYYYYHSYYYYYYTQHPNLQEEHHDLRVEEGGARELVPEEEGHRGAQRLVREDSAIHETRERRLIFLQTQKIKANKILYYVVIKKKVVKQKK